MENEEFITVDGQQVPNPNYKKVTTEDEPTVDYKVKFSESSKEANRLLEENKKKDAEIARLAEIARENESKKGAIAESLYPGFEELDEESKENLVNYTKTVEDRVKSEIYKDPAISFARQSYNEKKWNDAFVEISQTFPELASDKDAFKSKYYNPNNVPENITSILKDIAKIHLFDKAKEIGAREEEEKKNRIELDRSGGGEKDKPTGRTLEEWQRMQVENPAKFAKESKQFLNDMSSGKLKE